MAFLVAGLVPGSAAGQGRCTSLSARCVRSSLAQRRRANLLMKGSSTAGPGGKKKLEPEEVFFDGPPSWTEVVIPTISILTVIGIIPFLAVVARQFWVRYKLTSRRISVDGGFLGKDHVEIVYRDIDYVRFIRRLGGDVADMVIFLKDGAKLEMRSVPNFTEIFEYVMKQVPEDVREQSGPPK
eukprot:Plantae.Rhodophyta-Rhodochaete_pulchella.ctg1211.p2 GENE.Plantae.Rhodophyta-Rhodochaete_pulchella.ctg1211~~Plantae.Rhodophyta-Rhodochaete_pulchella.ctg1211.p2  ORF type:complete len:191 (+),score=24.10 Plantae.Rhodophyta-Rhodochaete_pulchella.ctg1211:26-574(+)